SRCDLVQVAPALEAGPLHVDKSLRIAPLVRLRYKQSGRSAGGARSEASGLDQLNRSQARAMHGGGDRDPENAAADHQDVGARISDIAGVAAEHGLLRSRELIAPDRARDGHDLIFKDQSSFQGTNRRPSCLLLGQGLPRTSQASTSVRS